MEKDFRSMTLEDCIRFIESTQYTKDNLHLAIVDIDDVYHGTVSLKNIADDMAEFGIVMCRNAHGTGMAAEAMREILRMGFDEMGIRTVYWYLRPTNIRALSFYDKNGYTRINIRQNGRIKDAAVSSGMPASDISKYVWYIAAASQYVPRLI